MILREIILIWYLISEPFNKVSFSELSDWDEIIASFIIRIKAGSHIDEDLHEFHFRWLKTPDGLDSRRLNQFDSINILKTRSSHAQQLWHETHAWLLDLEGNPINPETYIFNPICKNRLKIRIVFSENRYSQTSVDSCVSHELQALPENF